MLENKHNTTKANNLAFALLFTTSIIKYRVVTNLAK